MSSKEFDVNGTDYTVTITEQVIGHVNNLKNLYNAAYEDPESFEDVSSEISSTITDIASTVEPEVEDSDLDGLIQEIIKAVDNKAAEIEKELAAKDKPVKKSKSKKLQRRAHQSLSNPTLSTDSVTGERHLRHQMTADGFYRGRKVVEVKQPKEESEE